MRPSVSAFIQKQEPHHQQALWWARDTILACAPGKITEEWKYSCPYYYYLGPLVYLTVTQGQAYAGFSWGVKLLGSAAELGGDGTQVKKFFLEGDYATRRQALQTAVYEAMAWNEERQRSKGRWLSAEEIIG